MNQVLISFVEEVLVIVYIRSIGVYIIVLINNIDTDNIKKLHMKIVDFDVLKKIEIDLNNLLVVMKDYIINNWVDTIYYNFWDNGDKVEGVIMNKDIGFGILVKKLYKVYKETFISSF